MTPAKVEPRFTCDGGRGGVRRTNSRKLDLTGTSDYIKSVLKDPGWSLQGRRGGSGGKETEINNNKNVEKDGSLVPACQPIRSHYRFSTRLVSSFFFFFLFAGNSNRSVSAVPAQSRAAPGCCHFQYVYLFTECADTRRQLLQIDSAVQLSLGTKREQTAKNSFRWQLYFSTPSSSPPLTYTHTRHTPPILPSLESFQTHYRKKIRVRVPGLFDTYFLIQTTRPMTTYIFFGAFCFNVTTDLFSLKFISFTFQISLASTLLTFPRHF